MKPGKIVVDSSVIVKWVNRIDEFHLEQADSLLSDLESGKIDIITPEIARYEVGNSLLKKRLELPLALDSLTTVYNLPITVFPQTQKLAFETYRMAHEAKTNGFKKVTYYDAAFAALARQEEAILVTDNPKHQAKISGVRVVPLETYNRSSEVDEIIGSPAKGGTTHNK
ncbi:MAG: type II toxin-antitoxin system VapC family toxin [Candidatus Chisholmbacteria bacterium]|nr:type II toxin-antitoxin system VapC family toxin [Candidatus Chisholmbacteria bacterium]